MIFYPFQSNEIRNTFRIAEIFWILLVFGGSIGLAGIAFALVAHKGILACKGKKLNT